MSTHLFIHTTTFDILTYDDLKALPESQTPHPVLNELPNWPSQPTNEFIQSILNGWEIPAARFYETNNPVHEVYQVPEHAEPPNHYFIEGGLYKRAWTVRNMTQPELDQLNADRLRGVKEDRAMRYQLEADPIFFKAQRGETTSDEWLAKIAQIRAELPDPVIIVIPE